MIPYFLLIIIPFFFFSLKGTGLSFQRRKKLGIDLFFFIWLVLLCLRSQTIGIDLENYSYYFETSKDFSLGGALRYWGDVLEPGYVVFNTLLAHWVGNFQVFISICALIGLLPFWFFCRKKAELSYLCVALIVTLAPFPLYFSGLRQVIAMAFSFSAFRYAEERKLFKFILVVIAATLFHYSALIMLLMYPLSYIRIRRSHLWIILPVIAAEFVVARVIFNYVMSIVGGKYLELYGFASSNGAYMMLLLLCMLLFYSFWVADEKALGRGERLMLNMLVLTALIQPFASVSSVVMRLNYYYLPFTPLIICYVTKYHRSSSGTTARIASIVMTVFFVLYFFYGVYKGSVYGIGDILHIYPYVPFWEAEIY